MKLNIIKEYYADVVYWVVPFFRWSVYIVADTQSIKAIMFDNSLQEDSCYEIISTIKKEQTNPIREAILFFQNYQNRVFSTPPPCDVSLFTEKEKQVLSTLLTIKPGETISYGELAKQCGFTGAYRFIGNVMAKNLFPVVYPCHRVIRNNGTLGNYSGGVGIKDFLLEFEKRK